MGPRDKGRHNDSETMGQRDNGTARQGDTKQCDKRCDRNKGNKYGNNGRATGDATCIHIYILYIDEHLI
jgi:hypothetical protein